MRARDGVWLGLEGWVCVLVSKRYVHEYPACIFVRGFFFLHAFFSMGFSPWVFGVAQGLVVVSACLQGSSLEMVLPAWCSLGTLAPNRRDPTCQGTVVPRCGEDSWQRVVQRKLAGFLLGDGPAYWVLAGDFSHLPNRRSSVSSCGSKVR